MNEAKFQAKANPSEVKVFASKIVIYHSWSAGTLGRYLEICAPNASISAEVGITGVLAALDESDVLPDAYFIYAPIFGQNVTYDEKEQAIEFLNAHKRIMREGQKQPDIFLIRSNRSGESAKKIADRTGFSVYHLREEIFALLNAHGNMTDFQFLKDASRKVKPIEWPRPVSASEPTPL